MSTGSPQGDHAGSSRLASTSSTSSRLGPPSAPPSFPKQLSDKYRLGEELGRGAYGRVFRGLDTRTGEHVAIKQLSLDRISQSALAGIMTEVELLKALNHRNVVQYLGSFRSRSHLYIIMELVENGSLAAVIKSSKFGPFPESLVAVYIQQVLQGLLYLHDQGVVHRDIKGANILTTKEGLVKLADFGVAARLGDAEVAEASQQAPAGTPYWMAPEVVELKTVTTASDIWSVGCLAVELLTGQPPYYDLQPLSALYNIVQDAHPPLPPGASSAMQDFLLKCFQKDPGSRPSAKDLLQHPWITYNRRTLRSTWGRTRSLKTLKTKAPDAHATVASVVERILSAEARSSMDSEETQSPKEGRDNGGAGFCDSRSGTEVSGETVVGGMLARADDAAQQQEFLHRLDMDSAGAELLSRLEALAVGPSDVVPCPAAGRRGDQPASPGASVQDEAEVRRLVASLRFMAAPGERSIVEEAGAAASARSLVAYMQSSHALRVAFIAADGLCGVRELLDSSSERVLGPTMDLLLALTSDDPQALEAVCGMGIVPAALRFTGPQHPANLRLQAAQLAGVLSRTSSSSAHMLVACQGVPFFMALLDDAPQSAEQLELLAAAAAGFWALLQRTAMPGWPMSANQYLRLMAHHGLPQRLVRILPWVLKHATAENPGRHQMLPHAAVDAASQASWSTNSSSNSSIKAPAALRGMRPGNQIVPEDAPLPTKDVADAGGAGVGTHVPAWFLAESLVNLFAALAHGDAVVKARCCQLDIINAMFGLTVRMPLPLQLRVLHAVRRLSGEQCVLSALEAANVVAYVVAQLPREDAPALQGEALCTLHNLCQLSRQRQEKVAESGAVPWICRLAVQSPVEWSTGGGFGQSARSAAVAVLCGLAHCSPKTRAELWTHGGIDVLLQLLKEEPHQAAVLEGLASWLDAELPRIEGRLLDDAAVTRLVLLLPSPAGTLSLDQLPSILSPLARMMANSPRLAVALASSGLASRATELLKRAPPPTALALMDIVQLMYEAHPSPKDFIAEYRVGPALASLAAGAQAGDQVLVRKRANNLLQAFSVNAVI